MGGEIDVYRGRWCGITRAWAWRHWTSSRDGVAGGAADGDGVGDGGGRLSSRPGRATRALLAQAPAATAGGAGPPAGAAPAGRRRCAPHSSNGAGPGRCAGAAAVLNIFDTSNHKLVAHNRVPITQIVHNLKWFDIYIIVY